MRTSVKYHCIKNNISPQELFFKAWRDTRRSIVGDFILDDVKSYIKYGAVPKYVEEFLESKLTRSEFRPWYVTA